MNNILHKCIYSRQHLNKTIRTSAATRFFAKITTFTKNYLDLKKISRLKIKVINFACNHLFLTRFFIIQEPLDHSQFVEIKSRANNLQS